MTIHTTLSPYAGTQRQNIAGKSAAGIRAAFLLILFMACAVLLSSCGSSDSDDQLPNPPSRFYVLDSANVISDASEATIVAANDALYALTGSQIVIVTVDTVKPGEISDYASRLFNKWEIGSAEKNNGVLLLIAPGDEQYWVLQGRGFEEYLSSGKLKLMLTEYLEPSFKVKDYDTGAFKMFNAILEHIEGVYGVKTAEWDGVTINYTSADRGGSAGTEGTSTDAGKNMFQKVAGIVTRVFVVILIIVVLFVAAVLVVSAINSNNRGGRGGRGKPAVRRNPPPRGSNQNGSRPQNPGGNAPRAGERPNGGNNPRGGNPNGNNRPNGNNPNGGNRPSGNNRPNGGGNNPGVGERPSEGGGTKRR
jgi:Beta-propeller domains of methanol dehydrogenase type